MLRAALGDSDVPITITMVDQATGVAQDLSGYDTLAVIAVSPDGTESTLTGSAGGNTGEIDATSGEFTAVGRWRFYGRASQSGGSAQMTSIEPMEVKCYWSPA